MTSAVARVVWRKPDTASRGLLGALATEAEHAFAALRGDLAGSPEFRALRELGAPDVEGAATAKEKALALLSLAAEVEQALMVQYLYAMASVPAENPARSTIRTIAVQEMGHLATVQNLLLLVGGPDAFHLQRDQLRKASPDNPLPFVLRPVDAGSLAEYVEAEMPAEPPDAFKPRLDVLLARAHAAGGAGLRRVGTIYATLKWLLLPADQAEAWMPNWAALNLPPVHLSPGDLQGAAVIQRFQAIRGELRVSQDTILLELCGDAAQAVTAIDKIAAQGEGLTDAQDSHFQKFFALAQDFDDGKIAATPLATSPTLTPGRGGEGGGAIVDPYTRKWGESFARQYGGMTLSLLQALRLPRDGGAAERRRKAIAGLAIDGMKKALHNLFPVLTQLPLAPGGPLAGPPFDLDPALLEPADDGALTARQIDNLDRLAALYASIENDPVFLANPSHRVPLANLRSHDQAKRSALAAGN
jgi:hypothetical protein